jgi:hypothetical protein
MPRKAKKVKQTPETEGCRVNLSLDIRIHSPNSYPSDLGRVWVNLLLPDGLRVGYGYPRYPHSHLLPCALHPFRPRTLRRLLVPFRPQTPRQLLAPAVGGRWPGRGAGWRFVAGTATNTASASSMRSSSPGQRCHRFPTLLRPFSAAARCKTPPGSRHAGMGLTLRIDFGFHRLFN